MPEVLKPTTPDQALDAVRWAVVEEVPLEVASRGTKRALGRPFQADHMLDLSALSGIDLYEPEELVMTAGPGTSLAEIEAVLAERRQQLAFEPSDLGPLFGVPEGQGSIGGVFACNLSGPRRIKGGAARDHLLGLAAVSGRGEAFKAGGRVVKNVTGYDLPKLMCGSYGTLAALTGLTFKVLPAPETTRTILVLGLDDRRAVEALSSALRSPSETAGAAHVPAGPAAHSAVDRVRAPGTAVTALRVEGFGPSVASRGDALRGLMAGYGPVEELDAEESVAFWREVRDVRWFADGDRIVWKLSVPPTGGPAVAAAIGIAGEHCFDWGGGLVWLALDPDAAGEDGGAARVRAALAPAGGHATLIRAADTLRASVDVFQPQPEPLAALSARVKQGFDPKRILNPGRMFAGV
ncbi:MAG TPA: glycolate oxidase subunit GlcE [Alphaproteobacteria bacterium]|nr:glycolate oxidase subunit GlcE [Alphaproteobacteria bacterium]